MNIQKRDIAGITIVTVNGRMDTPFALVVERELDAIISGGSTRIVINLSKVDYLSSSGIRVFISAAKRLNDASGMLMLSSPNEALKQLFDTAQLGQVIPIHANDGDAVIAMTRLISPAQEQQADVGETQFQDAVAMEEEERLWNKEFRVHQQAIAELVMQKEKALAAANHKRPLNLDTPFMIFVMIFAVFPLVSIAIGFLFLWMRLGFGPGFIPAIAILITLVYIMPWTQRSEARKKAGTIEDIISEKEEVFEEELRKKVQAMAQE